MSTGTPTYPVKTIAKLLMVSERRVQEMAQEGVIPKSDRGQYELAPAVQGYITFLRDRQAGNATGGGAGSADYHEEKTRKVKAEADLAEMAAEKMRGSLVEASDVKRHLARIATEVRTRMRNIPGRVSPSITGDTDERRVKKTIADEIDQALTALADTKLHAPPDPDEDGEDDEGDGRIDADSSAE